MDINDKSYFRTSGYVSDSVIKISSGETFDISILPAFLRTLMVTDGTVTKALSAWFWEPVDVQVHHNLIEKVVVAVDGLEVQKGDSILQREVSLQGAKSKQIFAYARSVVSLKHLPEEIAVPLEKGEIGIGELLREKGIESYRDIFNINYLQNNNTDLLLSDLSGDIVSRSYRIRVNNKPAIIVTEFFPLDVYKKTKN